MVETLILLLVAILVIGIVVYLINLLIDLVPMDDRFRQICKILVILIAVLLILARALPLLGLGHIA